MIQAIQVQGITVFPKATSCHLVAGVNMIVGGNDSGKSHLLKLAYTSTKWTRRLQQDRGLSPEELQQGLARDVMRVFGTGSLASVVAQYHKGGDARMAVQFMGDEGSLQAHWSRSGGDAVQLSSLPNPPRVQDSIFITPKEVLSLYPCYMQVGKSYPELLEGASWDLCCALEGDGSQAGELPSALATVMARIEELLGGKLLRQEGRFYLHREGFELIELNLIAEGFKRLGMLGLLIDNGRVSSGSTLFWDEPEMNLNACHLPALVEIMLGLCHAGVQLVLSTHSLFLLRELHLQLAQASAAGISRRYIGLQAESGLGKGVRVCEAEELDDLEPLESMKAEIAQADKYLMMGLENDEGIR